MAKPLLDLTTLTERPAILIDGNRYEILSPDELSITDSARFQKWGQKLQEVQTGDLEMENAGEISDILTKLTDWIMVDVPEDVRGKLSDAKRLLVAEVFTRLFRRQPTAKVAKKQLRRTGAKSRRGSNASTAATPPAG